ncbi:class I SAM-dependent methyltransferase [Nonomuraea sp. NPDC050783]|uniref:class I SAM-dependent methyltransferase n=1 Tax=Nonomuraea sp. NPDC050783 TaxID=3154634 RepID=UPI003467924A
MTVTARYDAVADFYADGWTGTDDPATTGLLTLLGPVRGTRVLEIACGHGRVTRELARRGATVVGVDVSAPLIEKARAAERESPLGIDYLHADITAPPRPWSTAAPYDAVVCAFGLSDIDDLDAAVTAAADVLRPGGTFTCAILHPCFPGGRDVSGSWPPDGRYHDEGWWRAGAELSSLRRQVGANHRTLSTYLNTLRRHDLWLDVLSEPEPPAAWSTTRPDAACHPAFLVLRCVRRAGDGAAQEAPGAGGSGGRTAPVAER